MLKLFSEARVSGELLFFTSLHPQEKTVLCVERWYDTVQMHRWVIRSELETNNQTRDRIQHTPEKTWMMGTDTGGTDNQIDSCFLAILGLGLGGGLGGGGQWWWW